jgi:hypothetical protein
MPAVGRPFTTIVEVAVHPLSFIYVIVVVPSEIPVTTPILLTVAMFGLLEDQGVDVFGIEDPDNATVPNLHTDNDPEIVGS